jgi:uroporphyrinogen-III synthase
VKTALVTRPQEDAAGITSALTARGFAVAVEPMLEIVIRRGVALPLDGVQGILATSANGVRALAANLEGRDLPVWAVGDATAACARSLGFTQVESAGGDVDTLAALVAGRVDPAKGALLHAAGSAVAGDLAGRLGSQGFTIRREVLYQAQTAQVASPALLDLLAGERLDLALFFSPRTASTFATLTRRAERAERCRTITAYALSPAVAEALAALPWRAIHAAPRPEQDSLLAVIDQFEGNPPCA